MTPFTPTCPVCKHAWTVDLDTYTPLRVVYRGDESGPASKEPKKYRFHCPKCGEYFIQAVELDEPPEEAP